MKLLNVFKKEINLTESVFENDGIQILDKNQLEKVIGGTDTGILAETLTEDGLKVGHDTAKPVIGNIR